MTLETRLRDHLTEQRDAVPSRDDGYQRIITAGRRRLVWRRSAAAIAGAAALVLVVVGTAFLVGAPTGAIDAGGQTRTVELPGGFAVVVTSDVTTSQGAAVYVGELGPSPRFDTATLGTEIALTRRAAADLVVPPGSNPFEANALHAATLVYLGDLDGAQIALQVTAGTPLDLSGDLLCVFWGNGTPITGGGDCDVGTGSKHGVAADPPIGGWLVWTRLPEDTAVVQMRLPDGSTYWQRPTARTVFFNLPDGRSLDDATVLPLDAAGNVVTSW